MQFVGLRPIPVGARNEPLHPFATDRALFARTKAALAATGVRLLDIEVARIIKEAKPRDYLPAMEAAAQLGGKHVLSSAWCDDRPYIRDFFVELCALAAAVRPDGRSRVRHLVRHPHAERSSRARPRSARCDNCRHRRRHAAFRSLPRRPRDARLAAARMVSFRADQRRAGQVFDRARRADPHRSRRPPLSRRRRHRRGGHPATAARRCRSRSRFPTSTKLAALGAEQYARLCIETARSYLAASAYRRAG